MLIYQQGAIHKQVFDSLSSVCQTDSIIECFASPLNVYNRQYCSIFHQDLDCHFGSGGDFFTVSHGHFKKHSGNQVHEVNPPFSPGLMFCMVERLIEYLEFADFEARQSKHDGKLTFVIVVPTCASTIVSESSENLVQRFANESFKKMIDSRFFVKHIVLKAREHGYVEGSQHLRQTRYKESQYDTSVVILQSQSAREEETQEPAFTSNNFEAEIRKSFSSRHQLELEERRHKFDEGGENDSSGLKKKNRKEKQKKGRTK